MRAWLLDLIVCPECRGALRLDAAEQSGDVVSAGTLACAGGHAFPIVGGVPRFVQHALGADQARTRDSFGYEWTTLYPEHGHSAPERQAERDIFLEYRSEERRVGKECRYRWSPYQMRKRKWSER